MTLIDPRKTWRLAQERYATETNPVLRSNLRLLLTHMIAEAYLDMDALMSTVSPDAHYHFWSAEGVTEVVGKPAVAEFYGGIAKSGMYRLHHDIVNLVVDTGCIVTEGELCIAYPGALLQTTRDLDVDPAQSYLFRTQMLITWPVGADGLFIGEDSYGGPDGFAGIASRPIAEADIVTTESLGPPPYPAA